MSQPLLQLLKSNAGPNVTGNKRSRNDGGIDWMTKQELIDLATVEKVTFTKSCCLLLVGGSGDKVSKTRLHISLYHCFYFSLSFITE